MGGPGKPRCFEHAMHAPAWQVAGGWHGLLHPPQCSLSVSGSMHTPEHSSSSGRQETSGCTSGATSSCTSGATSSCTSGATSSCTSGATSSCTSGATSSCTSGATSSCTSGATSGWTSGATSGCTSGATSALTSGPMPVSPSEASPSGKPASPSELSAEGALEEPSPPHATETVTNSVAHNRDWIFIRLPKKLRPKHQTARLSHTTRKGLPVVHPC